MAKVSLPRPVRVIKVQEIPGVRKASILFESDQYELIDFSQGRKLERFAGVEVLRDSPAAVAAKNNLRSSPLALSQNILQFDRNRQCWLNLETIPTNWSIRHRRLTMHLKPTPFGHLGVFPEQAENWDWIEGLPFDLCGMKAIHLFAHTGGTTLALAARGANVTHVDASRPVVSWARKNAELSGLTGAPIRWIVDDALKYLSRELRRGNRYDIVVADPPAFGHGGRRMSWKFDRDIDSLFGAFGQVSSSRPAALLFTCHAVGIGAADIRRWVEFGFRSHDRLQSCLDAKIGPLDLNMANGRRINCGLFFRWHDRSRET